MPTTWLKQQPSCIFLHQIRTVPPRGKLHLSICRGGSRWEVKGRGNGWRVRAPCIFSANSYGVRLPIRCVFHCSLTILQDEKVMGRESMYFLTRFLWRKTSDPNACSIAVWPYCQTKLNTVWTKNSRSKYLLTQFQCVFYCVFPGSSSWGQSSLALPLGSRLQYIEVCMQFTLTASGIPLWVSNVHCPELLQGWSLRYGHRGYSDSYPLGRNTRIYDRIEVCHRSLHWSSLFRCCVLSSWTELVAWAKNKKR